jgi:hypothetical protein
MPSAVGGRCGAHNKQAPWTLLIINGWRLCMIATPCAEPLPRQALATNLAVSPKLAMGCCLSI